MTERQRYEVAALIEFLNYAEHDDPIDEVHHGMCVGSDTEFHGIVRSIDPHIKIIGHPAANFRHYRRADLGCEETRKAKIALDRNHDIVDECDLIIATPRTVKELPRSGTWATVRYARKQNKDVRIFEP